MLENASSGISEGADGASLLAGVLRNDWARLEPALSRITPSFDRSFDITR